MPLACPYRPLREVQTRTVECITSAPSCSTVGRVIAESEEDADTDVRPYMTKRKTGLKEGNVKTKSKHKVVIVIHWGIA
jgi:hypothetical protein